MKKLLVLLGYCFMPFISLGAEPWADGTMPVQNGLAMWFDCARQPAGREALGLPPLVGGSVSHLLDSSGNGRHLTQLLANARPRMQKDSGGAFLIFDGNDDALVSSRLEKETPAISVFLVAAPRANPGGFRAFFSVSRAGGNDFVSGLNLDFGPQATPRMSFLNSEGSGALGAAQLLRSPAVPFGGWHVIALESQSGEAIRLTLDGKAEGSRERKESTVSLQEFVLGARHYSLSSEPPYIQGFFQGSIAEVLLYNRILSAAEKASLGEYLKKKHAVLLSRSPEALAESLEPAVLEIPGDPPPRDRAELDAILKAASASGTAEQPATPFHIVLCAGPKDHGPCEHDYPLWQTRWSALLGSAKNVKISTAWEWPSVEQWQNANVIVFYSNNPKWKSSSGAELDAFLERGGGLLFIHYAVDGHGDVEALAQRIGYAWRGGFSKFRHGPLDLKFSKDNPLSPGFDTVHFVDESYWNLVGKGEGVRVAASGMEEGQMQPLIWTRTQGKGRVCVNILGHYTWTFDDPLFRILLLRGICWAGSQPVDRLSHLALPGARVAEP